MELLEKMVVTEDFIKRPDVYNCMVGGQGGDTWSQFGRRHSDKTKKILSERQKKNLENQEYRDQIADG